LLDVATSDRVLEERVPREHELAVDDEADHVVGVAGRGDGLDLQPTRRQRARYHREPELVFMHDVIRVRVRPKHVRRRNSPLRSRLEQRLQRRAGIDVHGRPALLVRDEIGVREPAWIHAPGYQHGR
jgi:hypothetical protein